MKVIEIKKFFPLGVILFVVLFAYPAFKLLSHYCGGDLGTGVYIQAIGQLGFKNLNPQLSLLGSNVYGEHFQPILLFLSLFSKIFSPAVFLQLLEGLFYILSVIPIILIRDRKKIGIRVAALLLFYLLFNRGVTSNIGGEINAIEWAGLPLGLFFYFIINHNKQGIFWSLFSLMLLGEQFALLSVGVVGYYFFKKENLSLHKVRNINFVKIIVAFSLLWSASAFYLSGMDETKFIPRPNYSTDDWLMILELFLPLIPLIYINWKFKDGLNTTIFWISLPLLCYVTLGGLWNTAHMAYIPIIFVFITMPANLKGKGPITDVTGMQTLAMLLLLLGPNVFKIVENVNILANRNRSQQCPTNKKRSQAIAEATHFLNFNQEGAVLVEGHLARGISMRPEVFLLFGKMSSKSGHKYLFLEKGSFGNSYPNTKEKALEVYEKFRPMASEIIYDNDYVFLAAGKFVQ